MSATLKATFAALPKTERGKALVLNGDPKNENFLYTNGNCVYIRNLLQSGVCDVYAEHSRPTTVARYSPTRFYIASGDEGGNVRIWDTTQAEHILKSEFRPIGGRINDIGWTSDSQRVAAVGAGSKFGHVFNYETGASTGEVSGHSKQINSVDFKPTRPFRMATTSEDYLGAFSAGPPFKLLHTLKEHTNFANSVRYSPDGKYFATAGQEGKIFLYDGETGALVREVGSPAHKGGIYAVSWSPDSTELLSASGDKTAKVHKVEDGTVVGSFSAGTTVDCMMLGCLWQGDVLMAVSLAGSIYSFNRIGELKRCFLGHNKPITALTTYKGKLYTADFQGCVVEWDPTDATNVVTAPVEGQGHTTQIQSMASCCDKLITCAMDDTLKVVDLNSRTFTAESVKLPSQPQNLAVFESSCLTAVACLDQVVLLRGAKIITTTTIQGTPKCVSFNPNGTQLAVGFDVAKIIIYNVVGDSLEERTQLNTSGSVMSVSFSPDGLFLASGDATKQVRAWSTESFSPVIEGDWCHSTARVSVVSWSPDSRYVAAAGVDGHVYIYALATKRLLKQIRNAHPMSPVWGLRWLDNCTLVSAGHDSCVRLWAISE